MIGPATAERDGHARRPMAGRARDCRERLRGSRRQRGRRPRSLRQGAASGGSSRSMRSMTASSASAPRAALLALIGRRRGSRSSIPGARARRSCGAARRRHAVHGGARCRGVMRSTPGDHPGRRTMRWCRPGARPWPRSGRSATPACSAMNSRVSRISVLTSPISSLHALHVLVAARHVLGYRAACARPCRAPCARWRSAM